MFLLLLPLRKKNTARHWPCNLQTLIFSLKIHQTAKNRDMTRSVNYKNIKCLKKGLKVNDEVKKVLWLLVDVYNVLITLDRPNNDDPAGVMLYASDTFFHAENSNFGLSDIKKKFGHRDTKAQNLSPMEKNPSISVPIGKNEVLLSPL